MNRTSKATWTRTVTRLRTMAEELKSYDFEVREPDNLETPPPLRHGRPSSIVEVSRMGGGDEEVPPPDRPNAEE